MSTHVDGAPPSVSPDPDDGEPDRLPTGLDDGSQWVRAEIQRRMAANRSTRGRHARRGDATPTPAGGLPESAARESPRREIPPVRGSQTVPLPPPGFVAAGDLPENYVPRHSVQTPGPAAEPAAPITGPIPVVRPASADAADGPAEPRREPVGGPSLPPTGMPLPVRKKRTGPGTPLSGGAAAAGPWSRPGTSIVPSEPVQRLGAPPGVLGGAGPPPSWGIPASPARGFAPAPARSDPVPDEGHASTDDSGTTAEITDLAEAGGFAVGPGDAVAAPAPRIDDDARDNARPHDADAEGRGPDEPDPEKAVTDEAAPDEAATGEAATGEAATDKAATDKAATDKAATDKAGAESDVRRDDEPRAAVAVAGAATATDPAEATTAVLPVVAGPTTDSAVPPPARLVGIPVQRASAPARTVTPRPVTPRSIPVVGTAPPEPGSTRVRVVLSERKGNARPVRTIKEVQEGTAVGDLLRRDLIRSQLMVTLRFGALAVLVLGLLPALLALVPAVGQLDVLGLRVPWLLLGVLMYPFLVAVAWRYTRVADRVEQNFADHVQD